MGKFKMRKPNPKGLNVDELSALKHTGKDADHSDIKNFAGHSDGKHLYKFPDRSSIKPVGGTIYPGGHNLVKGAYDLIKGLFD